MEEESMARQRSHAKDYRGYGTRDHKNTGPLRDVRPKGPFLENWNHKIALFVAINIVIAILSVVYMIYSNYVENIVITPLNLPKVVTKSGRDVPLKYWGTYNPGSYFGMRTRSPQTLTTGIMWFSQKVVSNRLDIRHWCEQWNGVKQYTWIEHDGENFGLQQIDDKDAFIVVSFIKVAYEPYGGDHTARILFKPKLGPDNKIIQVPMSLLFYVHAPPEYFDLSPTVVNEGHLQSINGYTESTGNFTMHFRELELSKSILKYNYLSAEAPNVAHLKEIVSKHHALFQAKERADLRILGLIGDAAAYTRKTDRKYKPNFIVYQATFIPPFELEVYFESGDFPERPIRMVGEPYDIALDLHVKNFEEKFEKIFKLKSKNFTVPHIKAARAALSNMIGGIGYFHGSSLVQSRYNKDPINYWNAPLYTAVPSRSFFPRGFLWDEGFHNLLIMQWDAETTKDIIAHWLDLMNIEGWIPREQILGPDARERVPAEFIVQKNTNANPPTFFLTLDALVFKMKKGDIPKDTDFLERALPRLKVWFEWFNKTQYGMLPGTYRWRGRDSLTDIELNPKTLTSGLDDFPRATHPTIDERHLDLRCWIALAAGVLADIGDYIGEPMEKYRNTYLYLTDNKLLDSLHWSEESQSYSDYGFHSTNVELVKKQLPYIAGHSQTPQTITVRVVNEEPNLRFIDNFGYVSLFPFLQKIIDPYNPKLGKVLTDLRNPKLLWTNYGLRSLARNSPYYWKYNTEHDPPYWRGAIWININYLAVQALDFYSHVEGPFQDQAKSLYSELRMNVVNNVLNEFKRTGFMWEQYNDKTGQGKGAHPFTGWSALFVLLMGEIY